MLPDSRVADCHFIIELDGGKYWLCDGGSEGGTFVDGKKVAKAAVRDRSTIYAGDVVLFLQFPSEPRGAGGPLDSTDESDLENEVRRIYESSVISLVEELPGPLVPAPDGRTTTPLEALYRIGRLLSSDGELGTIFLRTVEIVGEVLGASRSYLMLFDPEGNTWKTGAAWPASSENPEAVPPRQVMTEALQSGMSMLIHDARKDSRFSLSRDIRSAICAPLKAHRKTLGVLWADVGEESMFTEEHLKLITAIGRHAGGGIEDAREGAVGALPGS
jgi:hypothetical protein